MKPNNDSYDILIIGAGPSGIFTAYEAKKTNPALNILILEKGHSIEKRICPKGIREGVELNRQFVSALWGRFANLRNGRKPNNGLHPPQSRPGSCQID